MSTIVAISSPVGRGGIGIVRMSGDDVRRICDTIFISRSRRAPHVIPMMMTFGTFKGLDFEDKGYAVYFPADKAFTGEETVEFYLHGGVRIMRGAVERILKEGARMAEAGEFTRRAYLAGRMTLADAEGVADMINAESAAGLRAAYRLMTGEVSKRVDAINADLLKVMTALEAALDYPDETEDEVMPTLNSEVPKLLDEVNTLISTANTGRMAKNGISVAIAGHVNAGKSSLLNSMLKTERAIVTDIPGTTRDTVEGRVEVDGVLINLVDTAGIREADEQVEAIGVARAKEAIANADLILYVRDATSAEEFPELEKLLRGKKVFRVYNKTDAANCLPMPAEDEDVFHVSAKMGDGVEQLKHAIAALYTSGVVQGGEIITSERQLDALTRAQKALESATANAAATVDCVLIDLREAYDALGEITGGTATEDIVDNIFRTFCVGK